MTLTIPELCMQSWFTHELCTLDSCMILQTWNTHAWVMPEPADLKNACMLGSCRPAVASPFFGCLAMVATMFSSMDHAWEIQKAKGLMTWWELCGYRRQRTTFCGIHGGPTCVSTVHAWHGHDQGILHVWGFLIVTNWATFVFLKRLFVKNTIK